jgi:hypothetical protein
MTCRPNSFAPIRSVPHGSTPNGVVLARKERG